MDIKRSAAAALIDQLMSDIAFAKSEPNLSKEQLIVALELALTDRGFKLPTKCTGEAHSNPNIDNCSLCMPRWGWRASDTRVK